jgi:Uma2 family endonuclease
MSAVKKPDLISVEDYLKSELKSPVKREYVDGHVYAMADESNLHHAISGNTLAALHIRLRCRRTCKVYNSLTKIRIRLSRRARFYYPDVHVVRDSNPGHDYFQDKPVVIAEVVSRSTRRIDEVEKMDAYLAIPSLGVYLLIFQEMPAVVTYRRGEREILREIYGGLEAVIPLPEIGIELPLGDIYETIEFIPEPDPNEEM